MKKILFLILICAGISHAQECKLRYGVSLTPYKPYSWVEEGRVHGMNVELFRALADEAGCDYEIKTMLWPELLENFENKSLDIIVSSLSPFPDSHKGANVLQIPFNIAFYGYFYSRTDSPPVKNLEDLQGKTVLVLQGSVGHDHIQNIAEAYNITIRPYPTTERAMEALSKGEGDVSVFSLTAAINALEHGGYTNIRVSGKPVFPASYGFLFHDGASEYDILSEAMERLKAKGTYFDIVKKWQSNQNTSLIWIKRVAILIGIILSGFLVVMIWNKMLHEQVRKKTAELNQEIEQRKRTEQDNLKLRDEAMIAGKLAVLGEMATSIVHEINNPTGLIIHNVDFLVKFQKALRESECIREDIKICGMNGYTAMDEAEDALSAIDESLLRITNTINELKEYGREQTDSVQKINLADCLNIAVRLSRYFIKSYTNNFTVDIKEGRYEFYGNMLHIEQVIINLIHNACYALTDKNQKICCSLENHTGEDGVLYAKIFVADEGSGMSDEVKSKLFTPFFTTRKDSGGTGLGLSIISRLIKEHHGHIDVTSELGRGSTVTIYLPLNLEEA